MAKKKSIHMQTGQSTNESQLIPVDVYIDSSSDLKNDPELLVFSVLYDRKFPSKKYSYGYHLRKVDMVGEPLDIIVPPIIFAKTEVGGFWEGVFIELTKYFFQDLRIFVESDRLKDFLSYQYDGFEDKEGFFTMLTMHLQGLPEKYRPSQDRLDIIRHWIVMQETLLHPKSLSILPWQGKNPKEEIKLVHGLLKNQQLIACELGEFYAAFGYGTYPRKPQIVWYGHNRVLGYLLHRFMEKKFLPQDLPYDRIITSTGLFLNGRRGKFKKKNIPNIISQVKENPPKGADKIDVLIQDLEKKQNFSLPVKG